MIKNVVTIILVIILNAFSFPAWAQDGSAPGTGGSVPTSAPVQTSAPRTAEPAPFVSITPIPTPRPSPLSSSTPFPSATISPALIPVAGGSDSGLILLVSGIAGAGIIGGAALLFARNKNKKNLPVQKEENKCDSIKDLLEQKKKELEEMIRNWPEEKIKEIAGEKVLNELRKDDDVKKVLDAAEMLKSKHDKLKETIEMLEKRYDLCMLSLPGVEGTVYKGTIVENSLNDKEILKNLEIIKKYQIEDWLLHDVQVNEKQIEKLGGELNDGPWYMNFWQEKGDEMIVVFKDKSFKIKISDKSTWTQAIEYGLAKGIPMEQLDFVAK